MELNKFDKYHFIAWVLLVSIALCSCNLHKRLNKSIEKAKTIAYQNPKSFAEFCKISYPSSDSLGKTVIKYIPADNTNYYSTIDSLTWAINILKEQVNQDTSVRGKYYRGKINDLSNALTKLKNSYKPCKPDTVGVSYEVFRKSTSEIQALRNEIIALTKDNNDLKIELGSETKDKDKAVSHSAKQIGWIIGLAILLAASGYWNVRKLFF
jgi:hypothetical protein